jgi:hypothetical protein
MPALTWGNPLDKRDNIALTVLRTPKLSLVPTIAQFFANYFFHFINN